MHKTEQIINTLEEFAPPKLACSWDNSGWQIYLGVKYTNKIMLCLTVTLDIVKQAILNKCDLIISHHPLLLNKINSIHTSNNPSLLPMLSAIKNNVQVYSAHTNLDSCEGGIADRLISEMNLINFGNLPIPDGHLGRVGRHLVDKNFTEVIKNLKNIFNLKSVNVARPLYAPTDPEIKTIAVIPGAGGSLIPQLQGINIDMLITGDIRYHNALDSYNFITVDIGHFESERIILPYLKDYLLESNPDIEVLIADEILPLQAF